MNKTGRLVLNARYDIFFNKFNYKNLINEHAVESELFKLIRQHGYFDKRYSIE